MADFISNNQYLTIDEMKVNVDYITPRMLGYGWTLNAIAGMYGNMQTESTINPGLWENRDIGNMTKGYGLVQWTPASKYINWAISMGFQQGHPDSQVSRIAYEADNNIQWIHPSMRFIDFLKSNDTPYNLAMLFLKHYERPLNPDQPQRGTQANFWYEYISGKPWPSEPEDPADFFILSRKQVVLRRRAR